MENVAIQPQCQYFVVRKKRLCRMTVRPGRSYCGEHEPKPLTAAGEDDTRVACPYDSKHTCYASKLERHLAICNARPTPAPPYIQNNVNAPSSGVNCERKPLAQVSMETILRVVEKVHQVYEDHIAPSLTSFPQHPIHWAVVPEFTERGRTEASLRHLRQASSLLHIVEQEGMVGDGTCYVELGAGKGQLSLFAWRAWCTPRCSSDVTAHPTAADDVTASPATTDDDVNNSCVLLVDRAALRHKRDAKMRAETPAQDSPGAMGRWCRVRADLAHVVLRNLPACCRRPVVGMAKHLCGAATDFALRCLTNSGPRGGVLATCCHHRCEVQHYTGTKYLMELGISPEELNVMLGIVSWATCGDGRPRDTRLNGTNQTTGLKDKSRSSLHSAGCKTVFKDESSLMDNLDFSLKSSKEDQSDSNDRNLNSGHTETFRPDPNSLRNENQCFDEDIKPSKNDSNRNISSCSKVRENIQTECLQNKENGEGKQDHDLIECDINSHSRGNFDLHSDLNVTLSQEHVTSPQEHVNSPQEQVTTSEEHVYTSQAHATDSASHDTISQEKPTSQEHVTISQANVNSESHDTISQENLPTSQEHVTISQEHVTNSQEDVNTFHEHVTDPQVNDIQTPKLSQSQRTEAGRRAKALLDWGRVLYLRSQGFDARLCHFVPTSVSLENVCIIANKLASH